MILSTLCKSSIIIGCSLILFSCTTTKLKNKESIPLWSSQETIEDVYPYKDYLTAIGTGITPQAAKMNADSELSAFFNQTVKSETSAQEKLINQNNSTAISKSIERNIEISTSAELIALKHTDSYFDNKRGSYYVCSYIERNEAWKLLEPKLISSVNSFESAYSNIKHSNDALTKIILQNNALNSSNTFYTYYYLATGITPEKAIHFSKYDNQIQNLINENSLQKQKTKILVQIENDTTNRIKILIEEILKKNGFTITQQNEDYKIHGLAAYSIQESGDFYITYPQIEIIITKSGNKNLASFARQLGKVSSYTKDAAERMAINKIETELKKSFISECFNDKWSEK